MAHQRIDVHQHVAPRAYAAWLQAQGIQDAGGRELPPWSVQAALAPGKVKFNAELIDLEQDADGVTATVRDRTVASDFVVRARYLLACDGGRTIGRRLGVELQGVRDVMRIVSVYMSADLSHWARDPDVLIRWLWLPHRGTFGTLVPMGPDHWGPQSEEWVYHQNYENEDTRALDDSRVLADMKESLGLPYLDATIHVISRWSLEGILADRFRVGRVFFVGDALGFVRGASAAANLAGLRRALGATPADVVHRRRALAAIATQSMEFREHNIEYGET